MNKHITTILVVKLNGQMPTINGEVQPPVAGRQTLPPTEIAHQNQFNGNNAFENVEIPQQGIETIPQRRLEDNLMPEVAKVGKEWHATFNPAMRKHLLGRIIEVVKSQKYELY